MISFGEFRPSDVPLNHAAYDGTLKVHSTGPLVHYRLVPPSPITIAPVSSDPIGLLTLLSRFSKPQRRPSSFAPVCERRNPLNQPLGSVRINCDVQSL
jgi:hypothetical protein